MNIIDEIWFGNLDCLEKSRLPNPILNNWRLLLFFLQKLTMKSGFGNLDYRCKVGCRTQFFILLLIIAKEMNFIDEIGFSNLDYLDKSRLPNPILNNWRLLLFFLQKETESEWTERCEWRTATAMKVDGAGRDRWRDGGLMVNGDPSSFIGVMILWRKTMPISRPPPTLFFRRKAKVKCRQFNRSRHFIQSNLIQFNVTTIKWKM